MKPKSPFRRVQDFPELDPLNTLLRKPPLTTEDRLMHIRALGQRIKGYVRFMCAVGTLESCSGEAKQKAVTVKLQRRERVAD